MDVFLDTSAVAPLVLRETHTQAARAHWHASMSRWAWRWLAVEAEVALARRHAAPGDWRRWHEIQAHIRWLDLLPAQTDNLLAFNRQLGLRAAEAGHLFVLHNAIRALPTLHLSSFDEEMNSAAAKLGLPLAHG